MKLSIHPFFRWLIGAAIFALYILSLVEWQVFDGLIKAFVPGMYVLAAVLGAGTAGVLYDVLPTKKAVQESKIAWNTEGRKKKVIGYWKWIFCGVVLFVFWLPFYIAEM